MLLSRVWGAGSVFGCGRGRVVGVLGATAGLLWVWAAVLAGSAGAAAPCGATGVFSQSGTTAICTYSGQGTEDTFTVPANTSSVSVTAVGAPGGLFPFDADPGGLGALVVNTALPVPASSTTLWVDVGQAGPNGPGGECVDALPPGLFDGGAGSVCGGSGGGSSALLTVSRATAVASSKLTGAAATDARLLVAGGGGGGGGGNAGGGDAGVATVTGAGSAGCGQPPFHGGPGGVGPIDGTNGGGASCFGNGNPGTASSGGASTDGGGGGGGWFGGGAANQVSGGGGGSSYGGAGPSGGITITTAASTRAPALQISYSAPLLPANTQLPSIKRAPEQGVKDGATNGQWTNHPTGYTYQWLRCDTAGNNCVAVTAFRSGATYRPTSDDIGHTLRVAVIATNATGDSAPALSAPSAVVIENVPENLTLPSIKRDPVQGVKDGAANGQWTNHPNGYTYQWLRCDTAGNNCVAVTAFRSGATYLPTSDDIGHTLRVAVIATNTTGDSAPATSPPSAIVTEPPAKPPSPKHRG